MMATMPSPPKSYAFPPSSPGRRVSAAQQRASMSGALRTRRSSPLLHEIQGPSRRLSSHQVLLLTPFGGPVPVEAMAMSSAATVAGAGAGMTRGSSSMGTSRSPASGMPTAMAMPTGAGPGSDVRSTGMVAQPSSVGMGRTADSTLSASTASSSSKPLPPVSSRFNTRHQSLVQPVNPSPLSQPMATIASGSEQGSESGGSSSRAISREHSSASEQEGEQGDEVGPLANVGSAARTAGAAPAPAPASVVPMMRSNSLPVLTLRELDALKEKDGELGIARGTHWAWVSNGEDTGDDASPDTPTALSRTTPPMNPFAFQDPFAPLGTAAAGPGPSTLSLASTAAAAADMHAHPTSTSPDYRYSPTAEPRRMSEVASPWSAISPTDGRSRGASVVTVTPNTHMISSQTPVAHLTPPLAAASTFNSRASMSAIDQDSLIPFGPFDTSLAPVGTTAIRPRILRYKTSPARFTGLGLDIVVKPQPLSATGAASSSSSTSPGGSSAYLQSRRRSSQQSLDAAGRHRRSSQKSFEQEMEDRRRSSATSASSAEGPAGRKGGSAGSGGGVWAVADVVDTLSTTDLSFPSTSTSISISSSVHSLRSAVQPPSHHSPRGSVYTIEHVSSRSSLTGPTNTSTGSGNVGKSFNSLPSRKGKHPAFAFEAVAASEGFTVDPLAFPRRGSLAVLSQTALGPWAAKAAAGTEDLLGAPKGNWQDRRGSWAEGWPKK